MKISTGSPLAGAATIEQLNEILAVLAEYPDATAQEIADVTGYRLATVASVMAAYNVEN
jgi:NADH:ubiquinone oxidoreductase subunit E